MNKSSIVSIRNAVIAAVIAGILLWMIPAAKEYFVRLISWFWSGLLWCWTALMSSYFIPGWTLLILALFAIIGITIIGVAIVASIKKTSIYEHWYTSYVEDTLHGAKWRWRWEDNSIADLWCYCPRCDAVLVYDDHRPFYEKTDFICENCNRSIIASIPGGNKAYAIEAVTREIGRRIRTGIAKRKLEQFSPVDGEK